MQIAQQLKDAIRRGFKAIVVSLPHRADEAIRQNADLSGRLSLINMESWEVDDLKEIAKVGFQKLGIQIMDEVAAQIAVESLSSPQLMQYGDVVSFMLKGPNTRGKSRNMFLAHNGQEYDIYELIVKSIAENPPIMKLEFKDVKERNVFTV